MIVLPAEEYYGDPQQAKSKVITNRMHNVRKHVLHVLRPHQSHRGLSMLSYHRCCVTNHFFTESSRS